MLSYFFTFLSIFQVIMPVIQNSENLDKIIPKNPPSLVFTGDIMLSRSVGAMTKKYGVEYITKGYNPFYEVHKSLIFANLESPFSYNDRDTHEPSFYFASNPKNIAILEWLRGKNHLIISLANNHIFNA